MRSRGGNGQFTWIITDENGVEAGRVENIDFQNDLNTLDELYLASDIPTYFGATRWDTFGFSWDPNYNVGDNPNFPIGGYYPATYGFENETIGTEPAGWTTEYDGSGYIETVADLDGHKNVVHIRKNGGVVWTILQRNYTAPVVSGQVEFWLYKDTDSGIDPTFVLMKNTLGATGELRCHFESTNFYYSYDALGDRVLVASNIYSANSWIHVSIDFDTTVGW